MKPTSIFKVLAFTCLRKSNRDRAGLWKAQAALVVFMWVNIFFILMSLINIGLLL